MKSNFTHVLMLIGAILACVPIIAVDHLLDSYVRHKEKAVAQEYVDAQR